jgi:hypothetical protein
MELPFFGHKEEPASAQSTALMEHTPEDDAAEAASVAAFKELEPHAEGDGAVTINAPKAVEEVPEQSADTEPAAEIAPVTELPAAEPAAEEEPQAPVDPSHQISA